jgi:hypothetical protein
MIPCNKKAMLNKKGLSAKGRVENSKLSALNPVPYLNFLESGPSKTTAIAFGFSVCSTDKRVRKNPKHMLVGVPSRVARPPVGPRLWAQ